jgi:hypothetical protein
MFEVGIVLIVVGAMALAGMFVTKHKAGRLANTPFAKTGEAAASAGEKGAISVEGTVGCAAPLTSPVTHTSCLVYTVEVTAKWKVGEESESRKFRDDKQVASFSVDDGSGSIQVVPQDVSGLEDFNKTFDKTKDLGLMAAAQGGPIEFGDNGFTVDPDQSYEEHGKNLVLPPSVRNTANFEVEEHTLGIPNTVYVCGFLQEDGSIADATWQSLLMTSKSREDYLGATMTMVKRTKIVSMIALPLGGILALVGKLL